MDGQTDRLVLRGVGEGQSKPPEKGTLSTRAGDVDQRTPNGAQQALEQGKPGCKMDTVDMTGQA